MSRCVFLLALVALASGQGAVCPDGTRCSDGSCCATDRANRPYGCCPYLNAVCCVDREHCCPQDYHCDLARGMCVANGGHPMLSAVPLGGATVANQCPDGKTSCSEEATCCQLPGGGYACCPEKNAVCCKDHIHCCPQGTTCDIKDRQCVRRTYQNPSHRLLNML